VLGGVVTIVVLVLAATAVALVVSDSPSEAYATDRCVRLQGSDQVAPVDCDSADALRIERRINGTSDVERCPESATSTFVVTGDEPFVLCLRPA